MLNGPRTPASIRSDSSIAKALSTVNTSAAASTPAYFAATGAAVRRAAPAAIRRFHRVSPSSAPLEARRTVHRVGERGDRTAGAVGKLCARS
jgi:hypothetical protein